jgi:hypothetical protein
MHAYAKIVRNLATVSKPLQIPEHYNVASATTTPQSQCEWSRLQPFLSTQYSSAVHTEPDQCMQQCTIRYTLTAPLPEHGADLADGNSAFQRPCVLDSIFNMHGMQQPQGRGTVSETAARTV